MRHRTLKALVAGLLVSSAAVLTVAPVAQAFDINPLPDTCVGDDRRGEWVAPAPKEYSAPGLTAPYTNVVGTTFAAEDGQTYNYGATGYEWFGGASGLGLLSEPFVTKSGLDSNPLTQAACASSFLVRQGGDAITGIGWGLGLSLFDISASLVEFSQTANIIPTVYSAVVDRALNGEDTTGDGVGDGAATNEVDSLKDIYFIAIIAVFGAIIAYIIWLLLKKQYKGASRQFAMSALVILISGFLLANTSWVANTAAPGVLSVGGNIFSGVVSNVTTGFSNQADTALCQLGDTVDYPANTTLKVQATGVDTTTAAGVASASASSGMRLPSAEVRTVVCNMWASGVLPMWRLAQFGTTEAVPTVETDTYKKSVGDPGLQVNIPGLANQPATDLGLLHLAATNISPDEQRWLESYMKANPDASRNQVINTYLRGGYAPEGAAIPAGRTGDGGPFDDREQNLYLNGDTPVGTGAYTSGYQGRFEALVERVSDLQGDEYGSWSGASAEGQAKRAAATQGLASASIIAIALAGFFAGVTLLYQLMFALMLLFLPFALIGFSLPGRVGTRIGKEIAANSVYYLAMSMMGMAFTVLVAGMAFALPNIFGAAFTNPFVLPLFMIGTGVASIIGWLAARKRLSGGLYKSFGVDESNSSNIGRKVRNAAAVTGVVAAGTAAAAATGGTAGVVMAGKKVAATAGERIVRGGGGKTSDILKDTGKAHIMQAVSNNAPGINDEKHKAEMQHREAKKRDAREMAAKAHMDRTHGEGNHDYETTREKKEREKAERAAMAARPPVAPVEPPAPAASAEPAPKPIEVVQRDTPKPERSRPGVGAFTPKAPEPAPEAPAVQASATTAANEQPTARAASARVAPPPKRPNQEPGE